MMKRVTEYRDQAARYRLVAVGLMPDAVRARYLGWASDLESRADAIEAEEMAKAAERAAQGTEAQRAEIALASSVHDGPVAESDAP